MVTAKLMLGILGNATAIFMFLSPCVTFWRIVKIKSTQNFSGLPYVVTLFNCLLWVLYGTPFVLKNGILVLTINGAGVGFEVIYIILFLVYADKTNRAKVMGLLAAVVVSFLTIAVVTLLAVHHQATRELEVGSICVVVTSAMYVSPLSVMKLVIKTKSVAFMPFFLSLFIFFNSAVWTAYGAVTKDIFIMIPNGVGTLFGIAQLGLHAVYGRNKTPIDIEDGIPSIPSKLGPYPPTGTHMAGVAHDSHGRVVHDSH